MAKKDKGSVPATVGLVVGTGLIIFPDPATTLLGLAIVASILGVKMVGGDK
jgi:hypothetical protein